MKPPRPRDARPLLTSRMPQRFVRPELRRAQAYLVALGLRIAAVSLMALLAFWWLVD